jgi:dipeptidyl aminopeptidase/acylaminoacyl peptidase
MTREVNGLAPDARRAGDGRRHRQRQPRSGRLCCRCLIAAIVWADFVRREGKAMSEAVRTDPASLGIARRLRRTAAVLAAAMAVGGAWLTPPSGGAAAAVATQATQPVATAAAGAASAAATASPASSAPTPPSTASAPPSTASAAPQDEQAPATLPRVVTEPSAVVSQARPDLQPFTIDQLYRTRSIGGAAWSPDSRSVVFTANISGRQNLWMMPSGGGWPEQLTVSQERQADPAWSPDGRWIAYAADYGGNEQWDVFLVSTANGQVVNLTNTPEVSEDQPAWSPDGGMLAYVVKGKTAAAAEIDVVDVRSRQVRHVTSGTPVGIFNGGPLWSPDGKRLAFTRANAGGADSNVVVAPLDGGAAITLTPHQGDQVFRAAGWSPDGRSLLVVSTALDSYENVAVLDVLTRRLEWLTHDHGEKTAAGFSRDGNLAAWAVNLDGSSEMVLYDRRAGRAHPLPLPAGLNSCQGARLPFSPDGSRLLLFHNGPNAPRDLWTWSLAGGERRQLTQSLVGGVRGGDMVEPYLAHYPSSDGKWQISAFVYAPYNLRPDGTNPAVVLVHGGPTGQALNSFLPAIQYLVNQGYFVIAPNFRGSSGYGKAFQYANRFDWGGGDLQDVLAAAAWLGRTRYVDPRKIAVMGGSYGGYMTMMALTKAPTVFAAGVSIVPFVNLFTEFANEDPGLREYDRFFMGDPEKNKALWQDRSPINFVDRVKAPLLLLAGGNDPRDPPTEAIQVSDAIAKRGGVVEIQVYADEGHGFSHLENQIDAYRRVARFLKTHVPPPAATAAP